MQMFCLICFDRVLRRREMLTVAYRMHRFKMFQHMRLDEAYSKAELFSQHHFHATDVLSKHRARL